MGPIRHSQFDIKLDFNKHFQDLGKYGEIINAAESSEGSVPASAKFHEGMYEGPVSKCTTQIDM